MSTTTEQIKISVPDVTTRDWRSLAELKTVFSEAEIVAMCHRWCDTQDHAKRYRVRAAARVKAMAEVLTAQGVDVKKL